jgi:SagB-type dehydrogenase family enzyme
MYALQAIRHSGQLHGLARVFLLACSLILWPFFCYVRAAAAQETAASGELITLPEVRYDGELSLERAVTERRSVRIYAQVALSLEDLSQLLWAAQGITERIDVPPAVWTGGEWMGGLRTAPSAGALYPLELYVAVGDVTDLEAGLYRYVPLEHSLERVGDGDLREALGAAAYRQRAIYQAPAVLLIAAVYERTAIKYGGRAERYVHIEVGAAAENAWLQAEALGLGAVFIGAFNDQAVKQALGLPEDHEPLGIMPVGRRTEDWREQRFSMEP